MSERSWRGVLQEFLESRELISIYCDPKRPNTNALGFVDFISTDQFLLRSVSARGFYDGFALRGLEDIYRIEPKGEWEQKLTFLFEHRKQEHRAFLLPLDISCNLTREVLLAAKQGEFLARIQILGREIVNGWVAEAGEEVVTLNLLTPYGHDDGQSLIEIDAITAVNVDNEELQDLKLLARWFDMKPPT